MTTTDDTIWYQSGNADPAACPGEDLLAALAAGTVVRESTVDATDDLWYFRVVGYIDPAGQPQWAYISYDTATTVGVFATREDAAAHYESEVRAADAGVHPDRYFDTVDVDGVATRMP